MISLTAGELLAKLREIVDRERILEGEVTLLEDGMGNKCPPISVSCRGAFWALRVRHNDHLKMLAGSKLDHDRSFCKLPDYLIFAEPRSKKKRSSSHGPDLFILVCELKSSSTGAARGAMRQVQLGKFLAEHLVRLAMFAAGKIKEHPDLAIAGVIAAPSQLRARGVTRADEDVEQGTLDKASDMIVHRLSSDDDLDVEALFS